MNTEIVPEIVPVQPRRRQRVAKAFAMAGICGVLSVGGWLEATAWQLWGCSHTTAVSAPAKLTGARRTELIRLQQAEKVIATAYPHSQPTPEQALTTLVNDKSGDFVKTNEVTSNDAALSDSNAGAVMVNGGSNQLVLTAPSGRFQELEAYATSPGHYIYADRNEPTVGPVLGLVFSSIGLFAGIMFGIFGGEDMLTEKIRRRNRVPAWRQLVIDPAIGPDEPEDGFFVLHPEKEMLEDGSIRFVARNYEFDCDQSVWYYRHDQPFKQSDRVWTGKDDLPKMVEAWSEFCNAVTARNVANWKPRADERREAAENALLTDAASLASLLPPVAQVVDLKAHAERV